MTLDIESLPDEPKLLKQLLAKQQQLLSFLEEQFRLAQQKQFCASSEGYPGQGELFNEAEEVALAAVKAEEISYTRNKPKRKPLPQDLPRSRVVHNIDNADKGCGC